MPVREILFRGKRLDNGEWVIGFYFRHEDGRVEIWQPGEFILAGRNLGGRWYFVDPDTVGQYTGLTDKNGVKIFEGDILRYGDTIHMAVFEHRCGAAYFGLVYGPKETLPFGHYQDLRQLEVIGNVHDNPEILKGGDEG